VWLLARSGLAACIALIFVRERPGSGSSGGRRRFLAIDGRHADTVRVDAREWTSGRVRNPTYWVLNDRYSGGFTLFGARRRAFADLALGRRGRLAVAPDGSG